MRREAVKGLGFWGQSVDPVLLCEKVQPLLYDFNLEVCAQAGFTLSRFPIPQAAEAIATVLQSPHTPEPLQCNLIQALGWLAIPESLTRLEPLLYHGADTVVLESSRHLAESPNLTCGGREQQFCCSFGKRFPSPNLWQFNKHSFMPSASSRIPAPRLY